MGRWKVKREEERRRNRIIYVHNKSFFFVFGRTLAVLHEPVLLPVVYLPVVHQLVVNYLVPVLLLLEVQTVLRLIVVLFLQLHELLYRSVERLLH